MHAVVMDSLEEYLAGALEPASTASGRGTPERLCARAVRR